MADTDEKAYAAVEEALKKNPDASLDEIWDAAKSASPAVGKLSRRQFNAKYPLQIKRRLQREGAGGRKRRGGAKKAAARKGAAKKAGTKKRGGRKRVAGTEPAAEAAATPTKRRGRPPGGAKKATKKRGARKGGRQAAAPAAAASAGSAGGVDREAVRQEFLNFATELVNAGDQPKSLVKVLSGVDKYVDRVTKAVG